MAILGEKELKKKVMALFEKVGVTSEIAEIISKTTCEAELRGVTSHGMKMVPVYLERILKGGINPKAVPFVEQKSESVYLVNGDGGFGQAAVQMATEIIKNGVADNRVTSVGVYNTNHCGMLAYFTEQITQQYAIACMTTNTNPNTVAFGGAEKVLGTNPFSIAFPNGDDNIVIDMATTTVAKGKIYEYQMRKDKLPLGWAVDKDGKDTTDPEEAMKGALLPFGGYKGYAISLAVEILSGVITGAGYSTQVKSLHSVLDQQQNVGSFILGIPLKPFMDYDVYQDRLEDFMSIIKNSKKAPESRGIFFPGEIENNRRRQKRENGIEIPDEILKEIEQLERCF